jgi:hypothetical protein
VTVLAAPLILAAHAATLPTLEGWGGVAVYEGAALRRDDVSEYVTLGYIAGAVDPTISLEPVPRPDGQTTEVGTIASQLITAQADVATARSRLFDLIAPWSAWLVRDRTLGRVLLGNSELHLSVDVALATTRSGATGNGLVTITYTATTYG